jgi:hypothetical protein
MKAGPMGEDRYQGDDVFRSGRRACAPRREERSGLSAYNERRKEFEKPALSSMSRRVHLRMRRHGLLGRAELSASEFEEAHAAADHFSVLPATSSGVRDVVDQHDHYWVVEKFTSRRGRNSGS